MESLLNSLVKAIGWSIFHSLWQGAIVYALLLLVLTALPKLKSQRKHNLAYAAISTIFICYCITFFSIFKWPAASGNSIGTTMTLGTEYYQYVNSLPQQLSAKAEYLFPYLVALYGMGLALQGFVLCMGYNRLLRIKRDACLNVPANWQASFEQLAKQLNLRQKISFQLSDKINVPLVIGYFKPMVLFPIALATQLDQDQVEAILIHELSHIKRNDYLSNLIKTGIETLLFFNPFIWLSSKLINIEREHACDDLVLNLTGTPMTYAHALLKLEIMKDKSSPSFSMAATGKSQHLYQRIKRITDMKTNYVNARQQLLAITLTLTTIISLAWIKPSSAEINQTVPRQKQVTIAGIGIIQEPLPPQAPIPPTPPAEPAVDVPQSPPVPPAHLVPLPPIHKATLTDYIPCQDTTKKKSKYTIVMLDENGNKKEYHSLKEMPENVRNEVISETLNTSMDINTVVDIRIDSIVNNSLAFLKSPEWKKTMAEINAKAASISQHFNSEQWKKQQEEIRKNAESLSNHFNSEQWKKQQEELLKNSEEIRKKINSKEFKQKIMDEAKRKKLQDENEALKKLH